MKGRRTNLKAERRCFQSLHRLLGPVLFAASAVLKPHLEHRCAIAPAAPPGPGTRSSGAGSQGERQKPSVAFKEVEKVEETEDNMACSAILCFCCQGPWQWHRGNLNFRPCIEKVSVEPDFSGNKYNSLGNYRQL